MKIFDLPPSDPICCAQGRHGEVIIAHGNGKPLRWAGGELATEAGLVAPGSSPQCVLDSTPNYHIARIDVARPGACYYAAPQVTLTETEVDPEKGRRCKSKSYLSQASVNEVLVEDGGKYYGKVPNITLGDSHGQGAVIKATTGVSGATGITQVEVTADGPDQSDIDREERTRFPLLQGGFMAFPIQGNGTFTIKAIDALKLFRDRNHHTYYFRTNATPKDFTQPPNNVPILLANGYSETITYTVSGYTGSEMAVIAVKGKEQYKTGGVSAFGSGYRHTYGCSGVEEVVIKSPGSGFAQETAVVLSIHANVGISTSVVIEGYPNGHPQNTESKGRPISRIEIENSGDPDHPYLVAPELQIISATGFGAYATCKVKDGKIDEVTLENPGGGYKSDPEVRILSGGAEASVVARPHLRGLYQCYYRYVDDTPEEKGGPVPSNLSEVAEVDAGEAATSITWSVAAPSGRAKSVELWRTTGNQALTLYRVAVLGEGSGGSGGSGFPPFAYRVLLDPDAPESPGSFEYTDDLTDEELRNPDREGYEAMPIVLPNGELNANRFTPPPEKSVVVRFQDRFWYGVDGDNPNAVYFSEIDEPESVPEINEIIPQQSGLGSDQMTALIPFGTTLLLMQSRHAYSLTFSRQPLLDAQVSPLAYRGCLSQRAWGIHDGVLYVLDQTGLYAVSQSGQIQSLSDAVEDQFRQQVNWGASKWAFLAIDPDSKVVRAFVTHKDDLNAAYPTRALCYSIDSKGFWYEMYPQRISGSTQTTLSNGDYRSVYAAEGGAVLLDEGSSDLARGAVSSVLLTSPGRGYRKPPSVVATGGSGARFQATLDDKGSVSAIWILSGGTGYESGDLIIGQPDSPTHPDPQQAAATFEATPLDEDTPMSPLCLYKSGFAEYPTDDQDKRLGGEVDRSVSLTYAPQPSTSEISLRAYYNGSKTPRPNIAERDRGTGFRQDTVDPAARLDMAESSEEYGVDSGVAKAMFFGRSSGDVRGTDRHVATELIGPRRTSEPLILYQLDVHGASK